MNNLMSTRIPWLPFIPSDWKIAKVKQCFRISKELSYKKIRQFFPLLEAL